MAGIYGIIGDISKHGIFKKTLLHQKRYVSNSIVINKNTCIGLIDLNFQNIDIFEKDELIITLNGEYYTDKINATSSREIIYDLYRKYGDDFIKKIDGIFNICIYNKNNKQFKIFNDWAGNHNLFYYYQEDFFIFSTEIKAILKIVKYKTLNRKAAITQFMFSHMLYEETLINEIKLLSAGSILKYTNGELEIKKYYDLKNNYNPQTVINEKNDIETLYKYFEECTKKYLNKKDVSLPLTGGMDSRFLLHFMLKYNYDFRDIFTSETKISADVKIAQNICSKLGLKYRVNKLDYANHKNHFKINYIVHEGFLPHVLYPKNYARIYENKCKYIIQYLYTSMTFGDRYTPNTKDFLGDYKLNDLIIKKIIQKFLKSSESSIKSIFLKDHWYFDEIIEELRDHLNKLKEFNSLYIFNYFGWYQHCRRCSNIGGMGGKFIGRIAPTQDRELTKFCFNMPSKYHYWQYIYKKMFKIKCPDLAKFPREGTGVPLSWPNWSQLIFKAFNKKIVPEITKIDKSTHPETYYRYYVNDQIEQVFNSSSFANRGIFNVKHIKKIFDEHKSGKDFWYLIHNLMNLEIFLKEYLD